jgi:hypothetical protein
MKTSGFSHYSSAGDPTVATPPQIIAAGKPVSGHLFERRN